MRHLCSIAPLALLLVGSPLAAQAGTGGFRAGDLYTHHPAVTGPPATGAIVRVDPLSGFAEPIFVPIQTSSATGAMCYDPWRDRLIVWTGVAPNHFQLVELDAAGNLDVIGYDEAAGPSISRMAARGDGLVYMITHMFGNTICYLDAADQVQVLRWESGAAYGSHLIVRRMAYHAPSNSLVMACTSNTQPCPSSIPDSTTLYRAQLTPDGTRVVSEQCFPYEVSGGNATLEFPVGLAPGPGGDLILAVDTSSAGGKARLARVDVEGLSATPFAFNQGYSGDSVLVGGCYSQARNAGILFDTFNNCLRAYAEGESGPGAVLGQNVVSAGTSAATLVEITTAQFGLSSNTSTLSLSSGGTQGLFLDIPSQAGRVYWVLGSVSGWAPGLSDGGHVLPLNVDSYFLYTLLSPNSPPLSGALGVLDANGEASAAFTLPAGLDPGLAGAVFHHAALTFDASFATAATTNAVPLVLAP